MQKFLITALFAVGAASAMASGFTFGNLAVTVLGDGSTTLSSAGTLDSLYQYDRTSTGQSGSFVLSFNTNSANGTRLVDSGSATSDGFIALSTDGFSLSSQGYDANLGTSGVASGSGINRVVAQVQADGSVSYTSFSDGFTGNNIRSSVIDGSTFYAGGAGTGGGVRQGTLGSSTTSQISGTLTNGRVVGMFGGQVYATSASGAFVGLNLISGGAATNLFTLSGSSPYGFWFSDANNVYVADDGGSTQGIYHFVNTGGTWAQAGGGNGFIALHTVAGGATGARGLTGETIGGVTTLYATTSESSANQLIRIDNAQDVGASSIETLAIAPTSDIFRGIALTPQSVPEPASLAVLGIGAIALIRRRRARR